MARKSAAAKTAETVPAEPETQPCEECGYNAANHAVNPWLHTKALRERAQRAEGFVQIAYSFGVHALSLFALGIERYALKSAKAGTVIAPVHVHELEDVLTGDLPDVLWAIGIRARDEAPPVAALRYDNEALLAFAVETYCRAQAEVRIIRDVQAGMGLNVSKGLRMAESTRAIAKMLAAHYGDAGFPATFHRIAVRGVRGDNGSRIAVRVHLIDCEAEEVTFAVPSDGSCPIARVCGFSHTRYTLDRGRGFLGQLGWHFASEE